MKKTLLLIACLSISAATLAQLDVNKPTVRASASGLDPSIEGRRAMDALAPGLKLDENQNSKVTILIGQFLTHKSDLLMKSKSSDYKTRLADEQKILFDGLKATLSPGQFKQLMDLKPPQSNSDNAVNHLFY